MHQSDAIVLVTLVLASILAIKFAPTSSVAILVALVRYRRAVK